MRNFAHILSCQRFKNSIILWHQMLRFLLQPMVIVFTNTMNDISSIYPTKVCDYGEEMRRQQQHCRGACLITFFKFNAAFNSALYTALQTTYLKIKTTYMKIILIPHKISYKICEGILLVYI